MFKAEKIFDVLCDIINTEHGIDRDAITGKCQKPAIAAYRFIIARIMRERGKTLPDIARVLHRDHSTISNAIERCQDYCDTDKEFRTDYENIVAKLNSRLQEITVPLTLSAGSKLILSIELVP